jgi:hypothetical protein
MGPCVALRAPLYPGCYPRRDIVLLENLQILQIEASAAALISCCLQGLIS